MAGPKLLSEASVSFIPNGSWIKYQEVSSPYLSVSNFNSKSSSPDAHTSATALGDEDGPSEGDEEGPSEGDEDGLSEGDEDGPSEGDEDGPSEGDEDGTTVGVVESSLVGAKDGAKDIVGTKVGANVALPAAKSLLSV